MPKGFCTAGLTVTEVRVQAGSVAGTQQSCPLRAAGEGTETTNDCRNLFVITSPGD